MYTHAIQLVHMGVTAVIQTTLYVVITAIFQGGGILAQLTNLYAVAVVIVQFGALDFRGFADELFKLGESSQGLPAAHASNGGTTAELGIPSCW